jgi:methionyl-tRNA formyltransferase
MLAYTKGVEILEVVTQPDKAVGRKQTITPPPVKKIALDLGLHVIQPKTKKSLTESLKNVKADFFVVIAYGTIIPEEVIKMPKYGCINVHASLLPKYRGASPIQESLLNGDKETGISIMKIDNELDHGDVFFIKRIPIEEKDDLIGLSDKLAETGSVILPLVLHDIMTERLSPIPQNHKNATFCRKTEKEDGKISWNKTAVEIKNMIRAYTPWPSVYTEIKGKKIKILETEISEDNISPGKLSLNNGVLQIGTAKGCITPKTVQIEGKNPMDIKSFINGYKHLLN